MDLNKKNIKSIILIIFACILFYLGVKNIGIVADSFNSIMSIISPFLIGAVIAFIIKVPMIRLEEFLFRRTNKFQKSRRAISIVITLVLVIGIIVVAMYIVIPQIAETMQVLAKQIPEAVRSFQSWIEGKAGYWQTLQNAAEKLSINLDDVAVQIADYMKAWAGSMLNEGIGAVANIVGALINFFIGFIFAIYVLMKKETLARQGKQIVFACFKLERANKILYVFSLANETFSKFISGQCLDACILGFMFFVTMTIAGMPYAMLIAVMIIFTALIPMVGAFIGCVFGALLIVMVNPTQAIVFIVLFLILQQIEGNLVYPHIVGNSVGLPSIWVLVAITIGGNLMGVVGMILFIPLSSVAYALCKIFIMEKLKERHVSSDKWKNPLELDEDVFR